MSLVSEERQLAPDPLVKTGRRNGFRADIQGLRAVAVLLVVAFHAGVPYVTGGFVGVDVFFVISGFLITGLMIHEVELTGQLSLKRFYARRIRRLLPATAVVLMAVAALTVFALPVTRWKAIAGDILASSLYVVNWRLAERSVDYLGAERAASPVQHFWSLAVEEQFYIVWPLLILAVLWWQRRSAASLRWLLGMGLAVVAAPSLLWSVVKTASSPEWAYFVSTTRLWELALGGFLAIGAGRFTLTTTARWLLGWGGMASIVAAALLYDSTTAFPGVAALLPTLGALAVLASGTGGPSGVGVLLRPKVMQDVGAVSYSLYLWHWVFIVVASAVWGNREGHLPLPLALLAVTASGVPAWFMYRVVEHPIHRSQVLTRRPVRGFLVGAVSTGLGLLAASAVVCSMPSVNASTVAAPGARTLGDSPNAATSGRPVDSVPSITPDPLTALQDMPPEALIEGCPMRQERFSTCVKGDRGSDFIVALVGDSHASQWTVPLEKLGKKHGWRVEILTMSSCPLFRGVIARGEPPVPFDTCTQFNTLVQKRLTGPNRPDVVLTSGNTHYSFYEDGRVLDAEEGRVALVKGYEAEWRQLRKAGIDVVALRNTPRVNIDVPECVAMNTDSLRKCTVERTVAEQAAGDADLEATQGVKGVSVVDLGDYLCPGDWCPPVIGNVLVWRDAHHMTDTYAKSLAKPLYQALLKTGALRAEP